MDTPSRDEQDRVRTFFDAAAEVTGGALASAAGVGVGYALGGPPGAATGAAFGGATGPMARLMLQDMANSTLDFTYRVLGQREKMRVAVVVTYCYEKFLEKINAGEQLRQDGFFDDAPNERSVDKEVFEGIMLAAQREHQEKKLRYFGNLVANIAFEPEIARAQANSLIKIAGNLSYRQLCILALLTKRDRTGISLRREGREINDATSTELISLLQEINDLYLLSAVYGDLSWLARSGNIIPAIVEVIGVGKVLHELMELQHMPDEELEPLITLLR